MFRQRLQSTSPYAAIVVFFHDTQRPGWVKLHWPDEKTLYDCDGALFGSLPFQNQIRLSQQRLSGYITVNTRITHITTPNLAAPLSAAWREGKTDKVFTFPSQDGLTCPNRLTARTLESNASLVTTIILREKGMLGVVPVLQPRSAL